MDDELKELMDSIDTVKLIDKIDADMISSMNTILNSGELLGYTHPNGYSGGFNIDLGGSDASLRRENEILKATIADLESQLKEEREKVTHSELEEARKALRALL
jgi:hypothetical protein